MAPVDETPSQSQTQAAKPPRKRILRRYFEILGLLILALPLAGLLFLNQQAEKLLYYKYGKAKWAMQRPAICSPARKAMVYADQRPGQRGDKPLELSCEEALALPALHSEITNAEGLKLHTVRHLTGPEPQRPWLVYISGTTSTWLDATRYLPMAKRLGFNLASLDMSNHGISGNNGKGVGFGCREKADVTAMVDLIATTYPQADLLLAGTSTGTMGIANAAEALLKAPYANRIVAVVLENPPPSVRALVANKARSLPGFLSDVTTALAGLHAGQDFFSCAPTAVLKHLKRPTLVQTGAKDALVTVDMAEQAYLALPQGYPHQFRVFAYADHAALWNAQPLEFEQEFKQIWQTGLRFRTQ
ncbi:MAG: alpha/beta hydrolase [Candidatus Sericytochromatia bacterium]